MSQSLPNQYFSVPQAPAPIIPGSTRLVLIGGEQELLLELQIPPSLSALAPKIPILPLLCDRYMSEITPEIDRERLRFLVGSDYRDFRREQGPITDSDTCASRELEDGDLIQVMKDPSRAVKARMAAARMAITPETIAKAARVTPFSLHEA